MKVRVFNTKAGAVIGCVLAVLAGTGCEIRKAMYDQPRYLPLQESAFFEDGRASRHLVDGTIARGHLKTDTHYHDGIVDGQMAASLPMPVTGELLKRGQERFNIFCAPCHDQAGTGNGMIVQRGFKKPSSYHEDRLRTMPDGYFYGVIKNGFGVMQGYAPQVPVADRWAIVAYIRALQLSQHASVKDVPADALAELNNKK